jgi:hypothetical protein
VRDPAKGAVYIVAEARLPALPGAVPKAKKGSGKAGGGAADGGPRAGGFEQLATFAGSELVRRVGVCCAVLCCTVLCCCWARGSWVSVCDHPIMHSSIHHCRTSLGGLYVCLNSHCDALQCVSSLCPVVQRGLSSMLLCML